MAGSGCARHRQDDLRPGLAALLDLPHHELDALVFKPEGVAPLDAFHAEVATVTDADAWIVDGNYSKLRDVTWWRADTVVWLDYGLPVILWRVATRDLRRILARERLWDGQRMTWRRAFFGQRSVFMNALRKWLQNRGKYQAYAVVPTQRLHGIRQSPREISGGQTHPHLHRDPAVAAGTLRRDHRLPLFWARWLECMRVHAAHLCATLRPGPDLEARLRCHQIHIALAELFADASRQPADDSTLWLADRALALLDQSS